MCLTVQYNATMKVPDTFILYYHCSIFLTNFRGCIYDKKRPSYIQSVKRQSGAFVSWDDFNFHLHEKFPSNLQV